MVWRGSVSIAVEFVCPLPTLTPQQFRGDDHVHHHDDFLRRVVLGPVRLIRLFMTPSYPWTTFVYFDTANCNCNSK